jgi:hypothetical protein
MKSCPEKFFILVPKLSLVTQIGAKLGFAVLSFPSSCWGTLIEAKLRFV